MELIFDWMLVMLLGNSFALIHRDLNQWYIANYEIKCSFNRYGLLIDYSVVMAWSKPTKSESANYIIGIAKYLAWKITGRQQDICLNS